MRMLVLGLLALAACGDDGGGSADASNVPAMVTITGTASSQAATGSQMLAGVAVAAFRTGSEATPVATTTTDANGNYTLVVPTGGKPLDGFLKATLATYMDTYLYPPAIVTADLDNATIIMLTPNTFDLLANTLCAANQTTAMGAVAAIVIDAAEMAVAGAAVTSSPAATKVCYNSGGFPSRNATATDTDGVAYLFNVTGQATVSATKSGATFSSHGVNARAGAFTTTLIQP